MRQMPGTASPFGALFVVGAIHGELRYPLDAGVGIFTRRIDLPRLQVPREAGAVLSFALQLLGRADRVHEFRCLRRQVGARLVEFRIVGERLRRLLDSLPGTVVVTTLGDLAGALQGGLDRLHVGEHLL